MNNGNSGDRNSGHYNSRDHNSGHYNSGHYNSRDHNSGHYNSGNYNSGDRNSGHYNSGNYNSGHYNSGIFNSGNYNSGFFNSTTPKLRMFNTDVVNVNVNDIELCFPYINITKWINEIDMSKEEKQNNPSFHVNKGYLKTTSYKEAWKIWWVNANNEDKNKIKNLPNFDSVVFFDITGIEIEVDLNNEKKKLLTKAEKLMNTSKDLMNKAKSIIG